MLALTLLFTLATAMATPYGASISLDDVMTNALGSVDVGECSFITVGLTVNSLWLVEELSGVSRGIQNYDTFDKVPIEKIGASLRSKQSLVVLWDGIATMMDIWEAIDAVADLWHTDKMLVALSTRPIKASPIVPKEYGFRTVLLRKEDGVVSGKVMTENQVSSRVSPYAKALRSLRGGHLTASAYVAWPWATYQRTKDPATGEEVKTVVGLCPTYFDIMAKAYGFTYEIIPCDVMDSSGPNATELAAVPLVASGSADLSITWTTYHESRKKPGVVFFHPSCWITFVFSSGKPKEIFTYTSIYMVFSATIWYFLLGSIALIGAVLFVFMKFERPEASSTDILYKALSLSYMPMIEEGMPDHWLTTHRRTKSSSLVLTTWLLMGCLLMHSYKSQLKTLMMTVAHEETADSFEDVISQDKSLVMSTGHVLEYALPTDPRPAARQVYKERTVFYNWQKGMTPEMKQKVADTEYVDMLVPEFDGMKMYQGNYFSKEVAFFYHTTWIAHRGGPAERALMLPSMHFGESGTLTHMAYTEFRANYKIPLRRIREQEPIHTWQLATCFSLLLLGLVVSVLALVAERCVARRNKKRTGKK